MAAAFLRQPRVDAECVLLAGGVNGWRRLRCNMRFVNAFATSRRGARVNMPNTLAPPIAKQMSSLAWCTSGNQHASRKRDAGGDGIAQSEVPGVRFLAPSRACLQGLARTHRRRCVAWPSYRKGAHLSMRAVGWLHKRKVQTCVVIAIVDGSGGCHAVLVCVYQCGRCYWHHPSQGRQSLLLYGTADASKDIQPACPRQGRCSTRSIPRCRIRYVPA